jgi:CubicO group peptidase (beta-lactamase class C family)
MGIVKVSKLIFAYSACRIAAQALFLLLFVALTCERVFAQSSVSPDRTPVSGVASNLSAPQPRINEQVDQLFAKWDKVETPGAAIAVIKDEKIIYRRGYGMANLEYDIPNTPTTVFHIASVSKQFTAFAIYLLERENKLSLDDDVRKYLPELHDFGKAITIRQLLHHTSGLRDQWNLLALAGWRLEDVITEQDVLGLIWRHIHFSG